MWKEPTWQASQSRTIQTKALPQSNLCDDSPSFARGFSSRRAHDDVNALDIRDRVENLLDQNLKGLGSDLDKER